MFAVVSGTLLLLGLSALPAKDSPDRDSHRGSWSERPLGSGSDRGTPATASPTIRRARDPDATGTRLAHMPRTPDQLAAFDRFILPLRPLPYVDHADLTPEEQKSLDKLLKKLTKQQNKLAKAQDMMVLFEDKLDVTAIELAAAIAAVPAAESLKVAAEVVMNSSLAVKQAAKVVLDAAKAALKDAKALPDDSEQEIAAKLAAIAAAEQELALAKIDFNAAKSTYKGHLAIYKAANKAYKSATKLVSKKEKLEVKQTNRLAYWTERESTAMDTIDELEDEIEELTGEDSGGGEDPPGGGEDPPGGGEDPPGGGEDPPPDPELPWTPPATGLLGFYYDGKDLVDLVETRVDPEIDFLNWGNAPTGTGVQPDNSYSERWLGFVHVPTAGNWSFTTNSNDGVRLWIDDNLEISHWNLHTASLDTETVSLGAGWHSLQLEHFQSGGQVVIQLFWDGPGQNMEIIPQSALGHDPDGEAGEPPPPGGGGEDPPGGGEDPPGGGEDPPGGNDPPGDPPGESYGNPQGAVPVYIQEALAKGAGGFDRTDEMATFGLPFPEGAIDEVGGRPALSVAGSSAWQFRTLANWPDGSVKWALVDILADLEAGKINAGIGVNLTGNGKSAQADIASTSGGFITLDTGPLQARVPTGAGFNLLDRVTVDGLQLVHDGQSAGILGLSKTGLVMTPGPSTSVVLESNGPARAVVRADGTLRDTNGTDVIDFTCRLTARRSSRDIEVTFTVRNASIARPQHTELDGIGLVLKADVGSGSPAALFNTHTGQQTVSLSVPSGNAHLYMAYTESDTMGVEGAGAGYKPHIPKLDSNNLVDEGYEFVHDGSVINALGNRDNFPMHGYANLSGSAGGVTVAARHMPYQWPMAFELFGDGTVVAGVFTSKNDAGYTFTWRQHESRTVTFSFHAGDSAAPAQVARRLDKPLVGRAQDYDLYDQSGAFAYRLVTLEEQALAYAAMGIPYQVAVNNEQFDVTRFLPAHQTGGANNNASIERRLGGEFLRHGWGGQYLEGLDLALYKSEWQIVRSDDFEDENDPGANNDEVEHTTSHEGDKEHRYREGIVLAYHLTGDERFKEALYDEAEVLSDVYLSPQERSMYQTLRALAVVYEFTGDAHLLSELHTRVQFNNSQTIDVNTGADGWGWETAVPDTGTRRYFANSSQSNSEKGPGENYITRGFITGSFGPIAMFHASRILGLSDPDGAQARGRLRDLAFYARNEILPWQPDPATRHLVYSYGVQTQTVYSEQNSNGHAILLGQGEAYLDTGDDGYLDKGVEQIEQHYHQSHSSMPNDMHEIDGRLDVQHFIAIYLDHVNGVPVP